MRISRPEAMTAAMEFIVKSDIKGDYYEFGVFKGSSIVHFLNARKKYFAQNHQGHIQKAFLFDSFVGLPELENGDILEGYDAVQKGMFSCGEQEVLDNITKAGHPLDDIITIPGYYSDSLKREDTISKCEGSQIAFAHIDCDLYSSAKDCLEFITDKLVDGALVMFDDWFLYRGRPDRGVHLAFHEWSGRDSFIISEYFKYSWAGICFICNKK